MAKPVLSDLDFGNVARILNLPDPSNDQDPATKLWVLTLVGNRSFKDSVRVSTQSNIDLSSPGAAIDGITILITDENRRVLVRNQTNTEENGIYIWNGAAVPMTRSDDADSTDELEAAIVRVQEGTDANVQFVQTSVNFVLDTGAVSWQTDSSAAPAASETTAGIAEILTQGETDTGTDDQRILTIAKLLASAHIIKRHAANVGDGSSTQYDITHNLNSLDVTVEVFRNSGAGDTVDVQVSRPSVNAVRLNFASAPTTNQFRCVIKL